MHFFERIVCFRSALLERPAPKADHIGPGPVFEIVGGESLHFPADAPLPAGLSIDVIASVELDEARLLDRGTNGVFGRFLPSQPIWTVCHGYAVLIRAAFKNHFETSRWVGVLRVVEDDILSKGILPVHEIQNVVLFASVVLNQTELRLLPVDAVLTHGIEWTQT